MASGPNTGKKIKGPEIGLRQARRLPTQPRRRLEFLAEGLPIILQSAEGFWQSSQQVRQSHGLEAKVLEGFAQEEAAKILILTDAVRCLPKLIASKLNRIVSWFYDHLAEAEAVSWKPMHLAQLRDYLDQQRRGHYFGRPAGEYIMPTGLSISARADSKSTSRPTRTMRSHIEKPARANGDTMQVCEGNASEFWSKLQDGE